MSASRPKSLGPESERGFSFLRHSREGFLAFAAAVAIGLLPVLWNETMGSVPSGVWTVMGSAAMLASVIMTRSDERGELSVTVLVMAYLAAYLIGTWISYAFVGKPSAERESMLVANSAILAFGGLYYLFGIQVGADRKWGATIGVAIGYLGIVLHAIFRRDILTDSDKIYELATDGIIFGYQQLGDSLVLCTLVLMAAIRRQGGARHVIGLVVLAVVSITILFVIPSRSAAIFGTAAILLALVMMVPPRGRLIMLLVVAGIGVAVSQVSLLNLASGTRYVSLVDDDREDQSQATRNEILSEGLTSIREHPVLGHWAFQLERMGSPGQYVHNALDVWAQAGILPFLLFLAVWIRLIWVWSEWMRSDQDRSRAIEALPMLVFALLSWLIARNAAYVLLLFCLGYAAALPRGRHRFAGSGARRTSGRRRSGRRH